MSGFKIEVISDAQVEVLDVPTGHRFTFTIVERPIDGARILPGGSQVRINPYADLTENDVAMRVWNFAQRHMLNAGKIDALI